MLWWVGLAALLVPVGFATVLVIPALHYSIGRRTPTFVVGTVILSPSVWVYAALGVSLGCWIAVGLLRADAAPPAVKPRLLQRVAVTTVTAVGLLCMLPMAGLAWFTTEHQYRILSPSSPAGCRVVTAMTPMLFGTAGYVYLSTPGSIVLHRVQTSRFSYWWWSNDEHDNGYDPIDAGEWSLRWDGDQGYLSIALKGSSEDGGSSVLACPHR